MDSRFDERTDGRVVRCGGVGLCGVYILGVWDGGLYGREGKGGEEGGGGRGEFEVVYIIYILYRNFRMVVPY